MQIYEYHWDWRNPINKEFLKKFLKVFNYKDDDVYAELNHNIWYIEFADLFICEAFLDECIEKKVKRDKAIDYYWEQLEKFEKESL